MDIHIIDINTFPGTAPSSFVFLQSAFHGLTPVDVINIIIDNALQRANKLYLSTHKKLNNYKNNQKIKIGILLGGASNEKEISLESGRNVYYKLSSNYYEPKAIFVSSIEEYFILKIDQIVKDTTTEIEKSLTNEQKISFESFPYLFDFIFIGLHGGSGENGVLQKKLEDINIPFNGSNSITSYICMNKPLALNLLEKNNIQTTNRLLIEKNNRDINIEINFINNILSNNKKLIIKPHDDGCSAFVFISNNLEMTIEAIKNIFENNKFFCLLEEYINGIELTVGILGNQDQYLILPITKTIKSDTILSIEEKFLPGAGENITPAPFNRTTTNIIKEEIKKSYRILNCSGYARIDCFWNEELNKLIILECNTLPALTPATCLFHQAAELNINPSEFINYIIYLGFKNKKKEINLDNNFLVSIEKTKQIIEKNINNE
jgi:D-alanine-D-alanine ligase